MSAKRPVTPKDLLCFTPLSDPQISPDGTLVAYVVTTVDPQTTKSRDTIWLAPTRGAAPRALTSPVEGSDRAPHWSPDGTRIAFISDRTGKPQLHVIAVNGGEASLVLTSQKPGGAPIWSPDGKFIAFTASLFDKPSGWEPYPGAPEGDRTRAEQTADEPGGVKVITRLKFRLDGVGFYGDKRTHVFVVPADGSGPARQITAGDFDHTGPTWTPDSKSVICTALRRDDADNFNRSDIWRFDVATGEAALIYENPGLVFQPLVSPDGRFLIFAGHENQHAGSTSFHLMLLTLGDTKAVSLSAQLDRPVGPYTTSDLRNLPLVVHHWAADSQGVYTLVGDRGDSHLFYFPVDGSTPTRLTSGEDRTVTDFSVAADGTAAMLIGDGVTPDELFILRSGEERKLTDHGAMALDFDLVRPERFTYSGADGWPIDGWLIKPVGYEPGRRYPTVLSIHGGPHAAYGTGLVVQFQTLASAGFAVVYTNPRGSQTYGQGFATAVIRDWGGKDYQDIQAGLDKVIEMGIADPERLGVMGWSYGGYMTCWMVTQTGRFKAAIAGAPVVNRHNAVGTTDIPWMIQWHGGGNPWSKEGEENLLSRSPIRYADQVTTPTMVVCGESDLRCPIEQAEQFYLALRRIGKAPVVHIRYPGDFHALAKPKHRLDRYERTLAWFRHYLAK